MNYRCKQCGWGAEVTLPAAPTDDPPTDPLARQAWAKEQIQNKMKEQRQLSAVRAKAVRELMERHGPGEAAKLMGVQRQLLYRLIKKI